MLLHLPARSSTPTCSTPSPRRWLLEPVACRPRFTRHACGPDLHSFGSTCDYILGAMACNPRRTRPGEHDRGHPLRAWLLAAGTPTVTAVLEEFEQRFGVELVEAHGMTETNFAIRPRGGVRRAGTMGRAMPGFEARIVGENDDEMPDGVPGELVLRTVEPLAFASGYHHSPKRTFRHGVVGGYIPRDRRRRARRRRLLPVRNRLKDAIRETGETPRPGRWTGVVTTQMSLLSPRSRVPSSLGEDEVTNSVVPAEGVFDPAQIAPWCEPRLAYFAIPLYRRVVESLPMTLNGKVEKGSLRARGVTRTNLDREQESDRALPASCLSRPRGARSHALLQHQQVRLVDLVGSPSRRSRRAGPRSRCAGRVRLDRARPRGLRRRSRGSWPLFRGNARRLLAGASFTCSAFTRSAWRPMNATGSVPAHAWSPVSGSEREDRRVDPVDDPLDLVLDLDPGANVLVEAAHNTLRFVASATAVSESTMVASLASFGSAPRAGWSARGPSRFMLDATKTSVTPRSASADASRYCPRDGVGAGFDVRHRTAEIPGGQCDPGRLERGGVLRDAALERRCGDDCREACLSKFVEQLWQWWAGVEVEPTVVGCARWNVTANTNFAHIFSPSVTSWLAPNGPPRCDVDGCLALGRLVDCADNVEHVPGVLEPDRSVVAERPCLECPLEHDLNPGPPRARLHVKRLP